ncbi:MAG: GNAT family N-acetyltransferase [Deltaproteobacteria bacterium]|nr:GNAT family N-acetyltransferase [Deltaproteobacteria bacterium]
MFPAETVLTARLRLRRPVLGDAGRVFETYASDPACTRYLLFTPHEDVSDSLDFLSLVATNWRLRAGHRPWCVERLADGAFLGMIGATVDGRQAELGYAIGRPFWGHGYMTEAVAAVRDHILDDSRVTRVYATCHVENVGSAKVLEKAGFEREGILRGHLVFPNLGDEPQDCVLYESVRA